MPRFRKKPVVITAVQFTGENEQAILDFAPGKFSLVHEDDRTDDPEGVAEIYDELHSTWVLVYRNDWIIRGLKGEFYPCRDEVFQESYEEVQ